MKLTTEQKEHAAKALREAYRKSEHITGFLDDFIDELAKVGLAIVAEQKPFQREKDIRAGKLDNEMPGYEEITGWLQRVPMTWLPSLLVRCVKQCIVSKVFKDKDALLRIVDKATDPNDYLREAIQPIEQRKEKE